MKRVEVRCDSRGCPVKVRWRQRSFLVRVLDVWEDTGAWWEGEAEKVFYRVELASGGLLELYRDTGTGKWHVYRVYD